MYNVIKYFACDNKISFDGIGFQPKPIAVLNFLTRALTFELTFALSLLVVLVITFDDEFDSVLSSVDECKFAGKLNFLLIIGRVDFVSVVVGGVRWESPLGVNITSGHIVVVGLVIIL